MIHEHDKLCYWLARRYTLDPESQDEYAAVARAALIEAEKTYDASKGGFVRYASRMARINVLKAWQEDKRSGIKTAHVIRRERMPERTYYLHDDETDVPDGFWQIIYSALPYRQMQVVHLAYRLGLSDAAIGRILGVTRGSIQQTRHAALRELSQRFPRMEDYLG